jgi:hypothetical protein
LPARSGVPRLRRRSWRRRRRQRRGRRSPELAPDLRGRCPGGLNLSQHTGATFFCQSRWPSWRRPCWTLPMTTCIGDLPVNVWGR